MSKDWNITDRLFLDSNNKVCLSYRDYYDSAIPEISDEDLCFSIEEEYNPDFDREIAKSFNSKIKFNKDFEFANIVSYNFKRLKEDSNNFGEITLDYTNIINFNKSLDKKNYEFTLNQEKIEINGNDVIAMVSLSYTELINEEYIFSTEDIIIKPFVSGEKRYSIQYTRDKKVLAELLDGVLRVFPRTQEIIECIISSCTLIYEKY